MAKQKGQYKPVDRDDEPKGVAGRLPQVRGRQLMPNHDGHTISPITIDPDNAQPAIAKAERTILLTGVVPWIIVLVAPEDAVVSRAKPGVKHLAHFKDGAFRRNVRDPTFFNTEDEALHQITKLMKDNGFYPTKSGRWYARKQVRPSDMKKVLSDLRFDEGDLE